MKNVLISKDKLLAKIKENRDSHRKQFEEALNGWKKRVIEELEKAVVNAKKDIRYITFFELPRPDDHTPEYDAIIDQIAWHEKDEIELGIHEFNLFVRDDWGWKKDFLKNAAMYSKTL
jgi:hypothetical protein